MSVARILGPLRRGTQTACAESISYWVVISGCPIKGGLSVRILITNDDGVYSPGIAALAEVAARFGEVRIVAPDVEMSSASSSITSSRPLSFKRTRLPVSVPQVEAFRVNGTPADCVTLGACVWQGVELV